MRKNAELLFLTIAWLSVMGICLLMAVGRLLKVKNSKFLRMILVTACGFLGGMVIYLADWGNIVPTFVFFIAAIMICCEGSVIKRLTVGLMTASTVFSFNALVDNWSPFYQMYQIVIKIFFCAGLWILIRKLGPDRDFELAPSMCRLPDSWNSPGPCRSSPVPPGIFLLPGGSPPGNCRPRQCSGHTVAGHSGSP